MSELVDGAAVLQEQRELIKELEDRIACQVPALHQVVKEREEHIAKLEAVLKEREEQLQKGFGFASHMAQKICIEALGEKVDALEAALREMEALARENIHDLRDAENHRRPFYAEENNEAHDSEITKVSAIMKRVNVTEKEG